MEESLKEGKRGFMYVRNKVPSGFGGFRYEIWWFEVRLQGDCPLGTSDSKSDSVRKERMK
ncbi:hypothetical protein COLO4_35620 [Corchorus olitorius]|uniref:Uncharacterized protein n=1 Tax=Corchorus olitorius TaxID=93759 RepID=A0A1R3GEK3_9ROSI|nr:hypothetical protein COLO4_35620 [Corchorus olitorius]